jgi:hypothetical protein
MFKNTIKQFLYVTLQEKVNAINIPGKYVYCAGGSIARNSGAVNKKLTIQGECVKAIPHNLSADTASEARQLLSQKRR